jgi:hypothetical protein
MSPDRILIERNVKWLQGRQFRVGERRGMWATPSSGSTDHVDNSMTHFAMLALNEAERVGAATDPEVWVAALEHWQSKQNADFGSSIVLVGRSRSWRTFKAQSRRRGGSDSTC